MYFVTPIKLYFYFIRKMYKWMSSVRKVFCRTGKSKSEKSIFLVYFIQCMRKGILSNNEKTIFDVVKSILSNRVGNPILHTSNIIINKVRRFILQAFYVFLCGKAILLHRISQRCSK